MEPEWKTYEGKRYLFVDFGRCEQKSEMIPFLNKGLAECERHENVLVMTCYVNSPGAPPEFIERLKRLKDDPALKHIYKHATYGISGLKKVYFHTYSVITQGGVYSPMQ